jgi:hypothetical protein
MFNNPYLSHRLAKERVNEALREAERARLIDFTRAPAQHQAWPWTSILEGLMALLVRPRTKSDGLQPR